MALIETTERAVPQPVILAEIDAAVEAATEAFELLQRIDASTLDPQAVERWAVGVERVGRMADAAAVAVADQIDEQMPFRTQGFFTAKAWIQHRLKTSGAEAHRRVQTARAGRRLGHWRNAHLDGAVGTEQMELMARLAANPRIDDERLWTDSWKLLGDAFDEPYTTFEQQARTWEALADPDGARDRAERERERRHVKLRPRKGGGWRLTGSLDDLAGAELGEIFGWYCEAEWRTDRNHDAPRTASQRSADALLAMARAAAVADPAARRAHPTVNVLIDEATWEAALAGDRFDPARYRDVVVRTQSGHRLHPDDAINAALVGHVRRVVYDADSAVIDLGRRSRLFTGSARDAVMLLATTCSWIGCDRPVAWCDADHSLAWAAHGATVPRNGRPLCRPHHLMKAQGYRVHRDEYGVWHLVTPDGCDIT